VLEGINAFARSYSVKFQNEERNLSQRNVFRSAELARHATRYKYGIPVISGQKKLARERIAPLASLFMY
jgi:DNA invertase Pin-like site-specific DNA recombinase